MQSINIRKVQLAICEALNIDPMRTSAVTIRFKANQVPVVEVTQMVMDDDAVGKVTEVLKTFELVERPDADPTPGS